MHYFRRLMMIGLVCWCAFVQASEPALRDMDGNDIPVSSLKGNWVFINYWASWCDPCLNEIAEFNQFYTAHRDDHVKVFAVNYDTLNLRKQKILITKFGIHYPSLSKNPAKSLGLGDIQAVPTTFVFDPQGKLHDVLYGGQTFAQLNQVLSE